jgi:thiosulfate reductase cytochrome b subunit
MNSSDIGVEQIISSMNMVIHIPFNNRELVKIPGVLFIFVMIKMHSSNCVHGTFIYLFTYLCVIYLFISTFCQFIRG